MQRNVENVRSLVALVTGITKISFMRVTISEIMFLAAQLDISETKWTKDAIKTVDLAMPNLSSAAFNLDCVTENLASKGHTKEKGKILYLGLYAF